MDDLINMSDIDDDKINNNKLKLDWKFGFKNLILGKIQPKILINGNLVE